MSGVTYDSGALVAADRDERRMWLLHRRALERGVLPTVPAGVLAQCWRGGPQPRLSRLLAGCTVQERARQAGVLLGAAGRRDVVDASVVAGALERADVVFRLTGPTSKPWQQAATDGSRSSICDASVESVEEAGPMPRSAVDPLGATRTWRTGRMPERHDEDVRSSSSDVREGANG